MRYKVIKGLFPDEKKANQELKRVEKFCKHPHITYLPKTSVYAVTMFETDSFDEARKAESYFIIQKKICVAIIDMENQKDKH